MAKKKSSSNFCKQVSMQNARNAQYLGHFAQPKFIKEGHNTNARPSKEEIQGGPDAAALDSPTLERYGMFDRESRADASTKENSYAAREVEREPEPGIPGDYSIDDTGERTKSGKRIFKLNRR